LHLASHGGGWLYIKMLHASRWAALFLLLVLGACADDGSCKIETVGDLTVLNERGSPIVKATINDHPVALIVDSGAFVSNVWPSQLDKLDLQSAFSMVRMSGTGGQTMAGVATANTLGLGVATASNVQFSVAGTLFEGRMIGDLPVVGLFGAEFLSNFDVFFDLPDHRINLYHVSGCTADLAAWTAPYLKIPVDHDSRDNTKIILRLKLNGEPIDAFLDSGAQTTLIAQSDARSAGVHKSDLAQDRKSTGYGIDDEKQTRFVHRFDSLDIGSMHINHPTLVVGDTDHTLLGGDFLRHNRVWIPRYSSTIFVQHVRTNAPPATPFPSPHAAPAKSP